MSSEENDSQMEVEELGANGTQAEEKKVEETAAAAVAKPAAQTTGAAAAAHPHYRVKISGLPRFYTPLVRLLASSLLMIKDCRHT